MSYLLGLGMPVTLQNAVKTDGLITLQSASWDDHNATTAINLFNNNGDRLLQISVRQSENLIVFNSRSANGDWDEEEREALQSSFLVPNFTITIYDHGDRYQVLFSHHTVHYFRKRIHGLISSISYGDPGQITPFSQALVVSVYDALEDIALTNDPICSEIRPVPPTRRLIFDPNATTKPTFSHGAGPTAVPGRKKKDRLGFEFAEHSFLGDTINLQLEDNKNEIAIDYPFELPNGLFVTYGEINGLAGDFYGTYNPISDGTTDKEQQERFRAAFNTLAAKGQRQPAEAKSILTVLQQEVDAVNTALMNHEDPSVAYNSLPDVSKTLEYITWGRSEIPGYLGLAQINWDHFGDDARTAYNAGHETALDEALRGNLETAYTLNAFADHFLEDSFSAGHLRTPRRELHSKLNPTADLCAKYMHDEDCAIGISVQNPSGESWFAYGDKRALDVEDEDNKQRCLRAVQASADEIFTAWKTKVKPSKSQYKAWTHAPTLSSARGHQVLAPLFKPGDQRRVTIKDRRTWSFTTNWWYATTASLCQISGWWKYPITIDGPSKILANSAVAAIAPSAWHCRVYFQNEKGEVCEVTHSDGHWEQDRSVLFTAKIGTPLAAVSWREGKEIRIYCLSTDDYLQEWCYSNSGSWYLGDLAKLKVHVAPTTNVAAIFWEQDGLNITVYCQESTSDAIQEFRHVKQWAREATLPVARIGSSIAAVVYANNNRHRLRIYYQGPDLTLKEFCHDETWYQGGFNPGKAPRETSLTALGWVDSATQLRVYWQDGGRDFIGHKWDSGWSSGGRVVGPLPGSLNSSVIGWNGAKNVRFYYQGQDNSILEQCNDGREWFAGAAVASNT